MIQKSTISCSTFVFISILIFTSLSVGCRKNTNTNSGPSSFNTGSNTVILPARRMLALGDSYTIGEGVLEADRFPNQTIRLLKADSVSITYPATFIARTGWTTQNLLSGIANANPAPTGIYDLVTLLIGVNNQYQRRDTTEYRIEFAQCLNKALAFAGNRKERVFVLSIPDYGATPFGSGNAAQIALEIDRFNAINKEVCMQNGIDYTDITPSTRMAATDPTLIAADSLHPSYKEYAKWAEMLLPKMLPLVK